MNTASRMLLTALCLMQACAKAPPAPENRPQTTPKVEAQVEQAPAPPPAASAGAIVQTLVIASGESQASFMMDAPIEKIRGRLGTNAVSGELQLHLTEVSASTGTLVLDISALELFQTKADEGGKFGEETKNDTQNEHARAWLEIDGDAPDSERSKNRRVEFVVSKIESNVTSLADRPDGVVTADLKVHGNLTLHQQTRSVDGTLRAEFTLAGGRITQASMKTTESIALRLEDFDIRPREAFGILAKATLSVLSEKVAQVAEVSLDLRARAQ